MAQLTRSGKRLNGLNILFSFVFILFAAFSLSAQTPVLCTTSSTPLVVHAEGLSEPVGSLLLNCTGGTPGQTFTANLTATFPAAISNRINAAGTPDISLTLDTGAGPVSVGNAPVLSLPNVVSLNNITVTVPATRGFALTLSNVRLAVAQLSPGSPIVASFSSSAFSFTSSTATVGSPQIGLLANGSNTAITCVGSPLPTTLSVQNFFAAGTRFSSLRITEGFGNAFIPKDARSDTGTRILIRYSDFPSNARVFLPDYVAGNSATQPTAGGDLGGTQSGGVYTPGGVGTLLLARVIGPDSNGAGGVPFGVSSQFVGTTALGTVTEVPLANGTGVAAYEVIDANPFVQESAQIPTFAVLTASGSQQVAQASAAVSIGPVSTVRAATAADPIPRFLQSVPPSDCSFLGDCNANYFPLLSVFMTPIPLTFNAPSGGLIQTGFIIIKDANQGSSPLNYSIAVTYQNGSGFVFLDPSSGTGNATLRLQVSAAGLTPGVYKATVAISAGAAGSSTLPITLNVEAPTIPPVLVTSVTNAATFLAGPLVAGSLGTVKGVNLGGTNVAVTLDGIAAPILFKNATQINFQVPSTLAAKTSAQLVVTVDNIASAAQTVNLAAASPGIFGVLNQNGTVNTPSTPAAPGSIIQIFATGVSTASFRVVARLDSAANLNPLYAGDAPGLPGVQQVNVALPTGLTTDQPKLQVCSTNLVLDACSPAFTLTVR